MQSAVLTLIEDPAATAFGAAGLACQMIWPLFSHRRAMLGVQMGIGTNYGAQYALLDAWSGAAVCALGATQTLVAFLAGTERPWLKYLGLAFLPVSASVCLMTWAGIGSAFALLASTLIMLSRLQPTTLRLRGFALAAAPFGAGYDLSVGAWPALIGALLSFTIASLAFRREWRRVQA